MTDRPIAPGLTALPPTRHLALMAVGILAVGTSGPLIAAMTVPALAIAFWRNALGAAVTTPLVLLAPQRRAEVARLGRRGWGFVLLAGLLLALHFATWVPSISYTSVASSLALVTTQPIWAALLARATGHQVPSRVWVGMAVALAGVLMLTGIDFTISSRAFFGDFLALLGGVFAAGYVTAGAAVRRGTSTATYTSLCYAMCAALLLVTCLVGRQPLSGYTTTDWLKLLALTVGPQLLGHSLFNHLLRSTSPTVISMVLLFEVPVGAVIAAVWLGQAPPLAAIAAVLMLLVGIGIVVRVRSPSQEPSVPVE
ncbi:MAG: DMT family transporter [Sporichthyaceae bacterium]|nr:DMT family transporter [Sporichthyaceae bacterium]